MSENKMSEIIRASLDGIREFTDTDSVMGRPILTPGGVTVIPISRISLALATGGADYSSRKSGGQNFGGGGGTAVNITPIAFLCIDTSSKISLININETKNDRFSSIIEKVPEIIDKFKNSGVINCK